MALPFERAGAEALANTAVTGAQTVPEIIHFGDGRFAIVWQDASATAPDASGTAIRLQLFNADGSKAGAEVLVNTSVLNGQADPDIALLSDGSFVVTWTDASVVANGTDIRGQLFTSAGAKSGVEFIVNPVPLTGNQSASQVIGLSDGRFAVAWTTDQEGGNAGVRARIFTATGSAVGGEIAVNTLTNLAQQNVGIAALGGGAFVVTWQDGSGAAGAGVDIRAQIVSGAGAKVGPEILVSATVSTQELPAIVSLSGGGFVVAWKDLSTTGADPGGSIKARLYDGAGLPLAGEFLVNTTAPNQQSNVNLAALPGGGFVATWTDGSVTGGDTSLLAVRAQVFAADGNREGIEFLVNSITAGSQSLPAVAAWSGGITFAWQDASGQGGDASGTGIRYQRFATDTDGPSDIALAQLPVTETSIENVTIGYLSAAGVANSAYAYAIVADSSGGAFRIENDRLVVADNYRLDFEASGSATLTIRVTDQSGRSYDEQFVIALGNDAIERRYEASEEYSVNSRITGEQYKPVVAALADGSHVVIWVSEDQDGDLGGVYGQLYGPSGTAVGNEFRVNVTTAAHQGSPSVAALGGGGFIVVWEDDGANIYSRRYDGTGAAVGGEALVNAAVARARETPVVAGLADGSYAIAWTATGQDSSGSKGIIVRRFDTLGQSLGDETVVNTTVLNQQSQPAIAALRGGGYVVTWEALGQDGSGLGVYARLYDGHGAPLAAEFRVNSFVTGDQRQSSVAALADGGFVVAWQSDGQGGVYAQRFNATGVAQGSEVKVNASGSVTADPAVSSLPGGGFVIVWAAQGADGGEDVYAQRYDSAGNRSGPEFLVNEITGDAQLEAAVAASASKFFIVWGDMSIGDGEIHARDFTLTNAAPVAAPDTLAATEDVPATYAAAELLANDTDADGDALTVTAVGSATGGIATLNANGTIGFTPAANFSGTASFVYQISDGNGGIATGQADIVVAPVNDAPLVINGGTDAMPAIAEDAADPAGRTVAQVFGSHFSDPDAAVGDVFAGIAIVTNGAAAAQGQWQYLTGGVWTNVGTVFPAQALILPADTLIRFLPAANFNGTPTLAGHLIDSSAGPVSIGTTNVAATGGSTRYSASVVTLSQTVTAVADITVVGGSTAPRTFVEGVNGAADHILVNDTVTLSDPDSPPFTYVRVLITNAVASEDVLAFVNTSSASFGDITASFNAEIGSLLLRSPSGTATVEQFQAAVRAVTYDNLSEEPTQTPRQVQISTLEGTTISPALMFTINITAQNDSPSGTDKTVSIAEDMVRALAAADFGFSDVDGDAFAGVRFGSAPTGGTLYFDADGAGGSAPVAITTFPTATYSAADLAAGKVTFVPTANLNGAAAAKIVFTVVDNGGTVGAGQNADLSPNTLTLDISAVNDAPTATVTLPKGQPLGGETRINTAGTGTEGNSSIAALPGGGYVVAWQASPDIGGNATDIYLQRFDAAGAPLGGEVRVNSTIVGAQVRPDVSALAGGGFVVSWDAYEGVYAQRYDAGGGKLGGELLVHSSSSNEELHSASAAIGGGGFVVTWQSQFEDGSGTAIMARRYDSNGNALGGAVRVNGTAANDQIYPAVTAIDGGYVVVWASLQQDGSGAGIYGQRFSASGVAQGGEFAVNSTTAGHQTVPAIAALPGGGFIVTWESSDAAFNDYNIVGQRFDGSGAKLGGETVINSVTADIQNTSSVAPLAGGGYVVSWMSLHEGSSYGIYARRFDAAGNPLGGDTQVNTLTQGSQLDPAVAGLAGGDYLVTWTTLNLGTNPHQVASQRFGAGLVAVEGFALPLNGVLSIADVDAANGTISVTLSVGSGALVALPGESAVAVSGSGDASVTLSGTLAQLSAYLGTASTGVLLYQNDSDTPPPSTTLTLIVNDNGNSGAGGPLSTTASATILIRPLNDAPASADATRAISEDHPYILALTDFAFSDPDGNALLGVRFNSVTGGALYYDADGAGPGAAELVGFPATFSPADIAAGKLSFVPTANRNGTGAGVLNFTVVDDGPTGSYDAAAIHRNSDPTPNRIVFDIASVNDAPDGRELGATIDEDTPHVFTFANFGFSDPDGNAALNVIITTAPAKGSLLLDSDGAGGADPVVLQAGAIVAVSDIQAGRLSYLPAPNGNGVGIPDYDRVYFRLQDDGGTANGGVDTDPTPNYFYFSVRPINDSPVLTGSAETPTHVEGLGATPVDAGLTFVDVDSSTFSASARFSQGTASGDILRFVNDNAALYGSITGTWNEAQRQLLLSGSGTVAQWQNALRAVSYDTTSDNPGSFAREITFTIHDGSQGPGAMTSLVRSVNVTPVNDAPVANPDSRTINEDEATTFAQSSLTGNDMDGEGDLLSVVAASNAVGGTAVRNADGSVTFTPAADFNGASSFDYTVSDGNGGTAVGHVTIAVTPVNDAPLANADTLAAVEDTPVTFAASALTGNDSDVDDDPLNVTAVSNAVGGTAMRNADGSITFTPTADFNGAGGFDYTVSDGQGGTSTAHATVNVAAVNDAPVANPDNLTATEDVSVTFAGTALTGNDSDIDGDALSVTAVSNVSGGTAVRNADGSVTFTPAPNFNGTAGFDYTISDGQGGSATAHATIMVAAVNDAPVLTGPAAPDVTYTENGAPVALMQGLAVSDPDLPASFAGGGFTLVIGGEGGINLRASSSFRVNSNGDGTFTLALQDGPTQIAIAAIAGIGTTSLVISGFTAAATPARVNDLLDDFVYLTTSDNPATAERSVTLTFSDGGNDGGDALTAGAAQILRIAASNDAPLLGNIDGDIVNFIEDGLPVKIDLGQNATLIDPDSADFAGGTLTLSFGDTRVLADDVFGIGIANGVSVDAGGDVTVSGVEIGNVQMNGGADMVFTFNANATPERVQQVLREIAYYNVNTSNPSTATRTVTWTLTDGDGGTATATSTITVVAVDDAPNAHDDSAATPENAPVTGNVLGNDSDPDGGPKAVTAVNGIPAGVGQLITLASGATLTLNADGSYRYDPNGKYAWLTDGSQGALSSTTDSFSYTVTGSDTATVTVTITGVAGPGDQLRGGPGNDVITGTPQFDAFYLHLGGEDHATGLGSNDGFYLGAELSLGDYIDGGAGSDDQVVLQGDYVDHQLGDDNLINVETLVLLSGSDTRFGNSGGHSYDYWLKTAEANLAPGAVLRLNANALAAGEDVIFDGSAEGSAGQGAGVFHIYAGSGNDTFIGGTGADGFFFGNGGRFTAADKVDGGTGPADDQLVLRGDYSAQIVFGAATMTNVETLVVLSAADTRFAAGGAAFTYNLMTHDANVGANARLIVNANSLQANESLIFDGRLETDGVFRLIGGKGADRLSGGEGADELYGALGADELAGNGGADRFIYRSAAESTAAGQDVIRGFQSIDRIDLAGIDAIAGTPANDAFTFIGSRAFDGAGAASAGQLRLVGDSQTQSWLVEGDTDGDGVADFSLAIITTGTDTILEGNFIL